MIPPGRGQNGLPPRDLSDHSAATNEIQQLQEAQLSFQNEFRASIAALERSRQESETAAGRQVENIIAQLDLIEKNLSLERKEASAAVQNSNRLLLIAAGFFCSMALLAMVVAAWLQLRAMNRLAEVASSLHHLPYPHLALPGRGDTPSPSPNSVSPSLHDSISRLQDRVRGLEQAAIGPPATPPAPLDLPAQEPAPAERPTEAQPPKADDLAIQLGKGQAHLNLNEPEAALACFDAALELDPRNSDALVKKGTALERLRRLEDAIACYDQAISLNESVTLAYLYKGGICNQLERFHEALQCYELALRAQQKTEFRQHQESSS